MPSMKDVAEHAGVGIGTVSRYINNNGYLAEATRKKIAQAVKELGYTPNQLASNLARNKSMLIGVVVPDIEHPFFSAFTHYVEMHLYQHGYKTLICNTVGISDREKTYLEMLDRNIVDGIITCSQTLDSSLYLSTTKPIVALDHSFSEDIPVVYSNHRKGGTLAANLMAEAGCKNVIQFMTPANIPTPSNIRHQVFEEVLRSKGIHVTTYQSEWNVFDINALRAMFREKLEQAQDFDGIFAADLGAVCCLNILQEMGIDVPGKVKLVGYDGLNITRYTTPRITTISQNIDGLASSCVDVILKKINNQTDFPSEIIWDISIKRGNSI